MSTSQPKSFAELRGSSPLAVYIDLKSPYAYLAIQPTRDLAARVGVAIDWRPFTLDIPSYLGSAKLDGAGRVAKSERSPQQWSGVKYAYMDARRYANLTGKTVRGTIKIWDSSLAGIAMEWCKRADGALLERFLDRAYERFWKRDLDIERIDSLIDVISDVGGSADGFSAYAEGPGREAHERANREAFAAGVFGVPTYLVDDELWFGREHLPRVEWLLSGREKDAPAVANRSFA